MVRSILRECHLPSQPLLLQSGNERNKSGCLGWGFCLFISFFLSLSLVWGD